MRRLLRIPAAWPLLLGGLLLHAVRLESATPVVNIHTNLTVSYTNAAGVGASLQSLPPDIVTTNYDFGVISHAPGTNTIPLGATNRFALTVTNRGAADTLSFSTWMLGTNGTGAGFLLRVRRDLDADRVYDPGEPVVTDTGLLPEHVAQAILLELVQPPSYFLPGLYGLVLLTESAKAVRPGNDGRVTNIVWVRTGDAVPPSAPLLVSPADGLATNMQPMLVWTRATDMGSGVSNYRVILNGVEVAQVPWTQTNWVFAAGEGLYTWRIKVYDRAGNTNGSSTRSFFYDAQEPGGIVLLSPPDGLATNQPSVRFSWTASVDPPPSSGVRYRFVLNDVTNLVHGTGTNATLVPGTNRWSVRPVDRAGNAGPWTAERTVFYDPWPPDAPALAYPTNRSLTNRASVRLTWNAAPDRPPSSGISHYELDLNGTVVTVAGLSTNLTLPEGTNRWRVRAVDNARNLGAWSGYWTNIVDTVAPPAPPLLTPPDGAYRADNDILIDWQAVWDAGSGLAAYLVYTNDELAGVKSPTAGTGWWLTGIREGLHTWYVKAVDRAGNVSSSNRRSFTVDRTPPSAFDLVAPVDNGWVGTNRPTFVWTRASDTSGISNYAVWLDGAPVAWLSGGVTNWTYGPGFLPDGPHTWRVVAYDRAGNTNGSSQVWTVNVSVSGPVAPILIAPPDGTHQPSSVADFLWHPSPSPFLTNYRLVLNGSVAAAVGWNTTNVSQVLPDGVYDWHVVVYNRAGRSNVSAVWRLTVDTVPPSAPVPVGPADGRITNSPVVTLRWDAAVDAGGLAAYLVYTNGVLAATLPTNARSWTASGLREGAYIWYVKARDLAGHESASNARSFVVDLTAPSPVLLVSPTDGSAITNAMPEFVWTRASDNTGVSNYRLVVDGVLQAVVPGDRTNWQSTVAFAEGTRTWQVVAVDRSGRGTSSATGSFVIDRTPPSAVVLLAPTNAANIRVDAFVLDWTDATDPAPGSGVAFYEVEMVNGATVTFYTSMVSLRTQGPVLPGVNMWRVRAFDRAGNAGAWSAASWFDFRLGLYVKRMDPAPNSAATVTEFSNIRVEFSKPLDPLTVTAANIRVLRWNRIVGAYQPQPVLLDRTAATLWVRLPDISRTNDILARYRLEMDGLLSDTADPLEPHPLRPDIFGAPFVSSNRMLIARAEGGTVGAHLTGTEAVVDDARLLIRPGGLNQDAYVRMVVAPESSHAAVREANDRARRNIYQSPLDGFHPKAVSFTARDGSVLSDPGVAELELSYAAFRAGGGNVAAEEGTVPEERLTLCRLDEASRRWEAVAGAVVDAGRAVVRATVRRPGVYTLMVDRTPAEISESLVAYPNPFDPSKEAVRLRYRLAKPGEVTATVYTVTGEPVARLAVRRRVPADLVDDDVTWNGRNERGALVVNGIYLVKVQVRYDDGTSETFHWKVVVAK